MYYAIDDRSGTCSRVHPKSPSWTGTAKENGRTRPVVPRIRDGAPTRAEIPLPQRPIIMRTLLLSALLAGTTAQAQTCLPDGLSLTTQAQVDAFPDTYPGYTQVIGAVSISGGNITDLGPLSGLTSTGG